MLVLPVFRCVSMVALLVVPLLSIASESLPARNLLVQWRLAESASSQAQGGAIVMRSDGSGTHGGVSVGTRRSHNTTEGMGQLLVLNGAVATVRTGSSQPWQFVQAAWSGADGAGVAVGTQWVDSGQGLQVQPRWFNRRADVVVDLQADSSVADPAALPSGAVARRTVRTTLRLPLDQWFTVATSEESEERTARGVLSTRQSRSGGRHELQLRVSVPQLQSDR